MKSSKWEVWSIKFSLEDKIYTITKIKIIFHNNYDYGIKFQTSLKITLFKCLEHINKGVGGKSNNIIKIY